GFGALARLHAQADTRKGPGALSKTIRQRATKNCRGCAYHGPDPGIHDLGIEDRVSDWLCSVHSISGDRYGGFIGAAIDGHDAIATGYCLNAIQAVVVRNG